MPHTNGGADQGTWALQPFSVGGWNGDETLEFFPRTQGRPSRLSRLGCLGQVKGRPHIYFELRLLSSGRLDAVLVRTQPPREWQMKARVKHSVGSAVG